MLSNVFNILVADDEIEIVESITRDLKQLARKFDNRIAVFSATSATEIFNILDRRQIDALLLDYHFEGGINGDEIIDKIYDPFGRMLIILMSARDKEELEIVLIERHQNLGGRFRFLRKPFDELEIQHTYLDAKHWCLNRPYPFPIAYAYNVLIANSTSQAQVMAIKNLIEIVVKFSIAIFMADIHRLEIDYQLPFNIPIAGLTFNLWITWLCDLVNFLSPYLNVLYMPELLMLFCLDRNDNVDYLKLIHDFSNEVSENELNCGYVKDERWYYKLANKFIPFMQSLFKELAFTAHYILLAQEVMDFSENDLNTYIYKVSYMMGSDTRFPLKDLHTRWSLKYNKVYLYGAKGNILSLYPFLIYSTCDQCTLSRLYLIDNITKQKIAYNTFCNHRVFLDEKTFKENGIGLNLLSMKSSGDSCSTENVIVGCQNSNQSKKGVKKMSIEKEIARLMEIIETMKVSIVEREKRKIAISKSKDLLDPLRNVNEIANYESQIIKLDEAITSQEEELFLKREELLSLLFGESGKIGSTLSKIEAKLPVLSTMQLDKFISQFAQLQSSLKKNSLPIPDCLTEVKELAEKQDVPDDEKRAKLKLSLSLLGPKIEVEKDFADPNVRDIWRNFWKKVKEIALIEVF